MDFPEKLSLEEKIKLLKNENFPSYENRKEILIKLAKDESASVRALAIKLLSKFNYREENLFRDALSDPNPVVKKSASRAIKNIEDYEKKLKDKKNQINERLSSCTASERYDILKEIENIEENWVNDVYVEYLADPSLRIRNFIIDLIVKKKNFPVHVYMEKLNHPLWYVRSSVLKILGLKKISFQKEIMLKLLNDTNVEVRRVLAETLGRIGGENSLDVLTKMLNDPNPWVKSQVRKSLSELKSEKDSS
ncbi:MAG: HEAT repeat domain-containing protein [Acidobacteriota bacterium]